MVDKVNFGGQKDRPDAENGGQNRGAYLLTLKEGVPPRDDNLEFQVVVRNLEIDMRLVSPPDGHSENTGARSQLTVSCHDSSLPSKRI